MFLLDVSSSSICFLIEILCKFCPVIIVFNLIFSGLLFFCFKDSLAIFKMLFYFRYNQLIREYHKETYFETICYKLKITRNLLEKFGLYDISKFQC